MGAYWAGTPNYNNGNDGRLYLFPHWTCGGFEGSVATLQNPARQASAHYVIEGDRVAQLVNENDTAWHCGSYWHNHRSIGYELVGCPGNPPSRATLDTCAAMMADASSRYFGGAALVLGGNVMLHRDVAATSCPGETDIGYLLAKANEILGHGGSPSAPAEPTASPDLRYRVRAGGIWLPEMVGWHDTGGSSDTWAGNGSAIEYIAIDMPGWYQVFTDDSGWCDRVYRYDPNDLVNGAAGDGSPIRRIRCWYETPDPGSTGYYQIEYGVANVGEGFLPNMVDLTDTGGSSDDFAGNGGVIGRFRARLVN